MAEVTGYTKEKMDEILAQTVVSADVEGDNLILTKHDGSTSNAGDVRGPTGPMPTPFYDTWAVMKATTVQLGVGFTAKDQGIIYVGYDDPHLGHVWRRMSGDPNELWFSDFGAVASPNIDPGSTRKTANTTAIRAALAAALNSAVSTDYGPGSTVIANGTANGDTYWVNDEMEAHGVKIIGKGAVRSQFGRSTTHCRVTNTTVGQRGPFVVDSPGEIFTHVWLEGLEVVGDESGFYAKNCAGITLIDMTYAAAVTGNANNAAHVFENVFWVIEDKWDAYHGSVTPTANAEVKGNTGLMIIASNGGPIKGIAQSQFTNGITRTCGIRMENRSTSGVPGNNSSGVVFDNILSENQGTQALFQFSSQGATNGAAAPRKWRISYCERADGEATQAFITIDGGGNHTMGLSEMYLEGNAPYSSYLIKCINEGDFSSSEIHGTSNIGITIFDPANLPYNHGSDIKLFGDDSPLIMWLGDITPTAVTLVPLEGGGHNDVLGFGLASEAHLSMGIDSKGRHYWGSGSANPDIMLSRFQAGILEFKDPSPGTENVVFRIRANSPGNPMLGLYRSEVDEVALFRVDSSNNVIIDADGHTISLWPNEVDSLQVTDIPGDGVTSIKLLCNHGGVLSLQDVTMGAVDSGGSGYRSLRVPN